MALAHILTSSADLEPRADYIQRMENAMLCDVTYYAYTIEVYQNGWKYENEAVDLETALHEMNEQHGATGKCYRVVSEGDDGEVSRTDGVSEFVEQAPPAGNPHKYMAMKDGGGQCHYASTTETAIKAAMADPEYAGQEITVYERPSGFSGPLFWYGRVNSNMEWL